MTNNIEQLLQRSHPLVKENPTPDYLDEDVLFIHKIEHIPEVYSSKMYANVICFCQEGHIEMDINGKRYVAEQGDTIVCPSGVIVSRPMVSPDFKFTILALTDRIMQELLSSNMDLWTRAVYIRKEHIVRPHEEERRKEVSTCAWHFTELTKLLIEVHQNPFHKEMIHCLLQFMMLGYCSRLKTEEDMSETSLNVKTQQSNVIFNRFLELLRKETVKHRPVHYYANQLCITPKYLTFVCNSVSGKSAASFIHSAVVEEISHLLKSTTLSVKEIAQQMGFDNLSFFGKYVKAHLGASPNKFRQKLMQNRKTGFPSAKHSNVKGNS